MNRCSNCHSPIVSGALTRQGRVYCSSGCEQAADERLQAEALSRWQGEVDGSNGGSQWLVRTENGDFAGSFEDVTRWLIEGRLSADDLVRREPLPWIHIRQCPPLNGLQLWNVLDASQRDYVARFRPELVASHPPPLKQKGAGETLRAPLRSKEFSTEAARAESRQQLAELRSRNRRLEAQLNDHLIRSRDAARKDHFAELAQQKQDHRIQIALLREQLRDRRRGVGKYSLGLGRAANALEGFPNYAVLPATGTAGVGPVTLELDKARDGGVPEIGRVPRASPLRRRAVLGWVFTLAIASTAALLWAVADREPEVQQPAAPPRQLLGTWVGPFPISGSGERRLSIFATDGGLIAHDIFIDCGFSRQCSAPDRRTYETPIVPTGPGRFRFGLAEEGYRERPKFGRNREYGELLRKPPGQSEYGRHPFVSGATTVLAIHSRSDHGGPAWTLREADPWVAPAPVLDELARYFRPYSQWEAFVHLPNPTGLIDRHPRASTGS